MVSLAVGCSTLFVITVFSGVESFDASVEKPKRPEHDLSVFFRPMLGKRGNYFVPRLGKREEEEDLPYLLWDTDRSVLTGAKSHIPDDSKDEPEVQHPLMFRWYTPRLGRRASYFTPRLGKRTSFYTPRLGKRIPDAAAASSSSKPDVEDYSVRSPWSAEDGQECEFPRKRRRDKGDKPWKVIGMFNPRLGRSVPSEIPDYEVSKDLKNTVYMDSD